MSALKTDTLSNRLGTKSVPMGTVIDGSAKAWVNFNGTGTVAIRASFNVSSITDNGTGDYTVNFTNAFADGNYSIAGNGIATTSAAVVSIKVGTTPQVGSVNLSVLNIAAGAPGSSAITDVAYVNASFFR